ncbi:MAG: thioredoxin family protein, partial [Planctomycetota bacterium]
MTRSVGVKIAVAAAVVVLAVGAFVARSMRKSREGGGVVDGMPARALPRLVDLGSTTCIPCKMMKPVLEELRKEYAGRLRVEFIDVKADPEAGTEYGRSIIPTQIWYDASGKELM